MSAAQDDRRAAAKVVFAENDVLACARRLARMDKVRFPGPYARALDRLDVAKEKLAKARQVAEQAT